MTSDNKNELGTTSILESFNVETPEEKEIVDKLFATPAAQETFKIYGVDKMPDTEKLTGRQIVNNMINGGIVYLREPIPGKQIKLGKDKKVRPAPTTNVDAKQRTIERLQRTVERWFRSGELESTEQRPYVTTVRKYKKFLLKKRFGKKQFQGILYPDKQDSVKTEPVDFNNPLPAINSSRSNRKNSVPNRDSDKQLVLAM